MARAENPSKSEAEITVMTGPPPAAKLGRNLHARTNQTIARARALRPGEWFVWTKPTGRWKELAEKYLDGYPIEVYRTADLQVVVRHRDAAPGPTPDDKAKWANIRELVIDEKFTDADLKLLGQAAVQPLVPGTTFRATPLPTNPAPTKTPPHECEVDEEPGEVGDGDGVGGGGEEGSEGHLHGIVLALTTRQATLIRSYHQEPAASRTVAELGSVLSMARGYPDEVDGLVRRKLLATSTRADSRKVYGLTSLGRDVLSHLTGARSKA